LKYNQILRIRMIKADDKSYTFVLSHYILVAGRIQGGGFRSQNPTLFGKIFTICYSFLRKKIPTPPPKFSRLYKKNQFWIRPWQEEIKQLKISKYFFP